MPADAAVAAAGYWVDQAAGSRESLTVRAADLAASAWSAFGDWYDSAAVAAYAAEAATTSESAQQAVFGMLTQYVAELVAVVTGSRSVEVPRVRLQLVRNGADPVSVHSRPAAVYRETFAFTGDEALALQRALDRARDLVATDTMLAARQAQVDSMLALGVERYRRVLRPELSESGPCALCVVASDRIYRVKDLLPIHGGTCKCLTVPLGDAVDPAAKLNAEDLKRLYDAAGGSTSGEDLKRVRVQVREHGELGPVLTVRGQRFTGPSDLGAGVVSREKAMQQLAALQTVLDDLMGRPRSRQRDAALAFQRDLIARRRDRVA